jgi:hypothetical protein
LDDFRCEQTGLASTKTVTPLSGDIKQKSELIIAISGTGELNGKKKVDST